MKLRAPHPKERAPSKNICSMATVKIYQGHHEVYITDKVLPKDCGLFFKREFATFDLAVEFVGLNNEGDTVHYDAKYASRTPLAGLEIYPECHCTRGGVDFIR